MTVGILITGASGYIGGSILADFISGKAGLSSNVTLHAAVRSTEQANSMAGLGVPVLQTNLDDADVLERYLTNNEVDMVINVATSIDPNVVANLIAALGKRRKQSGKPVYFLHTTGQSAFDEGTGWPFGKVKDSDALFDFEKQTAEAYIVRQVDVLVTEKAEEQGVESALIFPPTVHGRGSGPWNKLSPQISGIVRAGISQKKVYKFANNREFPAVHVSDLTAFFARLVDALINGSPVPKGRQGYYFTNSHRVYWWDLVERLAEVLHARGLVADPSVGIWPSDEAAGKAFGVPPAFAASIFNGSTDVVGENSKTLGWQPAWSRDKMLDKAGDEVDDALELGEPKSSLLSSLTSQK